MPTTFRIECDTCGDYFDAVSDANGTDTVCPDCFDAERTRLAALWWEEASNKPDDEDVTMPGGGYEE